MNRRKPITPPGWIVFGISQFRRGLILLHRKMFPANVVLYEQFQSFYLLPSLYVAAELNLAEYLKTGAKTIEELASSTGTDSASLFRVIRALAGYGIFKIVGKRKIANTGLSRALLDQDDSLRYTILHHLGRFNWSAMSDLLYCVRTGKDAVSHQFGMSVYDYLNNHPDQYRIFDRSMANLSNLGLAPILQAYDFSGFRSIADLGGGEGYLLANILSCYPEIHGILFDVDMVGEKANACIQFYQLSNRMKVVTGDFFHEIPVSADCYLVKNILHNWDDTRCISLLHNLRQKMTEASKLLVMEMVVSQDNRPSFAKMLDIQMLATLPGGKERSVEEYDTLVRHAGLKLNRIVKTISPLNILEIVRQ